MFVVYFTKLSVCGVDGSLMGDCQIGKDVDGSILGLIEVLS